MTRSVGFPPIARRDARVLILGTMPGPESLRLQQYYGHPQNWFWPIMDALFGAGPQRPYARRVRLLLKNRVAVWDVLRACRRPGALDTSIVRGSERPNDFAGFLARHRELRAVFCNGQTARALFQRLVLPTLPEQRLPVPLITLPSTSPAHAGIAPLARLAAWRRITEFLA